MDIQATKLEVMPKIMGVSKASLLQKNDTILEEEMIVAYTTNGKPLTRKLYDNRLEIAQKQIIEGKYTTQEDLEIEYGSW